MTLPSPDGCFVQVWDQPHFTGASDYINGPRRYATLRDMPGRRPSHNRIRSMDVGRSAVVTIWSDENFGGSTLRLLRDAAHPELPSGLTAQIESMVVECTDNSAESRDGR
jgi:hypothetical protein